ncbi:MAG: YfhO family protein, partial [Oscillospiraceae bacterium]|nr:YfhO family protein [Oscillospiraceae bacterium]
MSSNKQNRNQKRNQSYAKNAPVAKEPGVLTRLLTSRRNILAAEKKNFNFCILGFLIPFICSGLALLFRALDMRSDPNAVFSILNSDAYYQYYPFLLDFRRNILSGEGLLYTWNIGMGVDY